MTTSTTSASTRKFQFFDEIKEEIEKNEININDKINKTEEENTFLKKIDINISSIVPIKEMQIIDGIIFVCANVFRKGEKQTNKNQGILKIIDNQIIDEYIMFNEYYDYTIIKYLDKPLLIVFGSMKKMDEEFKKITSIKFYNPSYFIEKRMERYPIKEQITEIKENYPDILQREIKLYKKGNSSIICEAEGNKIEGLNSIEGCKNFTIDSLLNYAAISLDKGQIIVISGFPNLLDCKGKKIKANLVSLPEKGGENVEITNIKFGELFIGKNEKKILYVSTKNFLAYYEWNLGRL